VADGAAVLDTPVVPDAEHGAVFGDERRADWHAALVSADACLLEGVGEVLVVAVLHRFPLDAAQLRR
jgi:hypothetical protein